MTVRIPAAELSRDVGVTSAEFAGDVDPPGLAVTVESELDPRRHRLASERSRPRPLLGRERVPVVGRVPLGLLLRVTGRQEIPVDDLCQSVVLSLVDAVVVHHADPERELVENSRERRLALSYFGLGLRSLDGLPRPVGRLLDHLDLGVRPLAGVRFGDDEKRRQLALLVERHADPRGDVRRLGRRSLRLAQFGECLRVVDHDGVTGPEPLGDVLAVVVEVVFAGERGDVPTGVVGVDAVRLPVGQHLAVVGAVDVQPFPEDSRGRLLDFDGVGQRSNRVREFDSVGVQFGLPLEVTLGLLALGDVDDELHVLPSVHQP